MELIQVMYSYKHIKDCILWFVYIKHVLHCKKNNRKIPKSTGSSLEMTFSINFTEISVNSKTQCSEV